MRSHTRRVHTCLAVACHLHFWQNDRDLLRAIAVTREWNGYRNKSQRGKFTLEKKTVPPLLRGLEPATFELQVRRSNHWAIHVPLVPLSPGFGGSVVLKARLWRWRFSGELPVRPNPLASCPKSSLSLSHTHLPWAEAVQLGTVVARSSSIIRYREPRSSFFFWLQLFWGLLLALKTAESCLVYQTSPAVSPCPDDDPLQPL